MKLVWLKSNLPLSLFIRAVTGEDCSHFSFVFESKASSLMFESNLFGTHPAFYATALKTHVVVHELDVPMSQEDEDKVWDAIVQRYDGKPYDFAGAIYLGWRKLLNRFLKLPIPKLNAWSQTGAYYCDDLYDVLSVVPTMNQVKVTGAMITPHDLWVALCSAR